MGCVARAWKHTSHSAVRRANMQTCVWVRERERVCVCVCEREIHVMMAVEQLAALTTFVCLCECVC